jgi:hypothetical protein
MGGAEIFVITRHWITTSNRVGIPRQAERARVIRARSDKRQKALAFFVGADRPILEFRDRHGREGRELPGLAIDEYINRLGQDLIPLAKRCVRIMREALAVLEMLRAGPSHAVERSRPAEAIEASPQLQKKIGLRKYASMSIEGASWPADAAPTTIASADKPSARAFFLEPAVLLR